MADLTGIYSAGTISVAAGGTTVTGVGTSFVAALIRAGDLFCSDNFSDIAMITETPTVPTSLKIEAWPGSALAAGSNYKIVRLSDAGRIADVMMEFVSGLATNVGALAGLELAANKGIYATGAGSLGTFDQSAFARTLMGNASAAAWLAALGAQSRFSGLTIPGNDYNNATMPGIYNGTGSAAINGPPSPSSYGALWVGNRNGQSGQIFQISGYGSATSISLCARGKDASNPWGPWQDLMGSTTVLSSGTVMRFTNGTQICTVTGLTATYNDSATLAASWVFPATFLTSTGMTAFWSTPSLPAVGKREMTQRVSGLSNTGAVFHALNNNAWVPGDTLLMNAVAHGRWM